MDECECGCGKFFTVEGRVREHICLPAQVSNVNNCVSNCLYPAMSRKK